MIERERLEGELKEAFKVLGSTGNVYTVTISHVPSCDCPDALKGNHCKHILFIFLKVLGVPESSGHYYQKYVSPLDRCRRGSLHFQSPSYLRISRSVRCCASCTNSCRKSQGRVGLCKSKRESGAFRPIFTSREQTRSRWPKLPHLL